jgi:hypothetical protein
MGYEDGREICVRLWQEAVAVYLKVLSGLERKSSGRRFNFRVEFRKQDFPNTKKHF